MRYSWLSGTHTLNPINWHVVRNAASISVIASNHVQYDDGALWNHNASMDLATINVPSADCKYSDQFATDSDLEEIGEKIYVYGNPQGLAGTFSEGILSARRANGAIFQISAPLNRGSSGSPVFNEYGMVIGMIYGGNDTNHKPLVLSANVIWEALNITSENHPPRVCDWRDQKSGCQDQCVPTTSVFPLAVGSWRAMSISFTAVSCGFAVGNPMNMATVTAVPVAQFMSDKSRSGSSRQET